MLHLVWFQHVVQFRYCILNLANKLWILLKIHFWNNYYCTYKFDSWLVIRIYCSNIFCASIDYLESSCWGGGTSERILPQNPPAFFSDLFSYYWFYSLQLGFPNFSPKDVAMATAVSKKGVKKPLFEFSIVETFHYSITVLSRAFLLKLDYKPFLWHIHMLGFQLIYLQMPFGGSV